MINWRIFIFCIPGTNGLIFAESIGHWPVSTNRHQSQKESLSANCLERHCHDASASFAFQFRFPMWPNIWMLKGEVRSKCVASLRSEETFAC